MRFDRASLEELEVPDLTEEEKKAVLAKWFPKTQPALKEKLRKALNDSNRWNRYLGTADTGLSGVPYRFSPAWILERALLNPPKAPGIAVTDFSGWIFGLYNATKNAQSLADGRYIEQELVRRYVGAASRKGWDLIHEGITRTKSPPKQISSLSVRGQQMLGSPDFVFHERKTGRIVIVEVKVSHREIPSDGWPNLRAQLWAYGHCDEWHAAPESS